MERTTGRSALSFSLFGRASRPLLAKDTKGSRDGKGKDSYYYWKADKATNSYVGSVS